MLMLPSDDLFNQVGRFFGPHERGRMIVQGLDIATDVSNERTDAVERAATDRFPRQDAEPDYHQIEPRGACGGEVKLHPRVSLQPRPNRRCRMRGRIIENDMQVAAAIPAMQPPQEVEELHRGVAVVTGT